MAPRCISREDVLKDYIVPTEQARDFELNGIPAKYASGHPKDWGTTETFDFRADVEEGSGRPYQSYHSALSPDKKLLAVSCHNERILIYDIFSKELRQVLEGAGSIVFRPRLDEDESAEALGKDTQSVDERSAYTIVSSVSNEVYRGGRREKSLTLWDLDQHGRLLDEEEPIDPDILAANAINVITPELMAKHEWTKEFIDASTLHKEFVKALSQVASEHRRRHNTVFADASLGGFGSTSFSNDGKFLLYHVQNRSTQQSMREPEKLPQVVVYGIDVGKEFYRLSGHTDAIMWSAMSPNSQFIATISWDGTMRMYSASNGELSWCTEDSGGQSWAGSFSQDSRFIVWSSKSGQRIQVHDVTDGRKLSTFGETLTNWCRSLEWHPSRHEVTLCVGTHAYVWDVFGGSDGNGAIVQHFALDGVSFMVEVEKASWMDKGRLLSVEISDGTKLVYDPHTNTKELFRRPKGMNAAFARGFYGLLQDPQGNDIYLSVDGDAKVRYWRDSVPAYPSWWEKPKDAVVPEKTSFPETGKYVKITRAASKGKEDSSQSEASEALEK